MKEKFKRASVLFMTAALMMLMAGGPVMTLKAAQQTEENVTHSLDSDTLAEIEEFIKDKWNNGELETREDIEEAIDEAVEKFDGSLDADQKKKMADILEMLQGLGVDLDVLGDKLTGLYEKYGDKIAESTEDFVKKEIIEPAKEAAVDSAKSTMKSFFSDFKDTVGGFFKNIFGGN